MGKKLGGRSDIYALGVILYEMMTGRVPFKAETPMAVMIKHINDPLLPPHKFNATLPETIERVILKALAKQPEDRYASAGDFVASLQAAIQVGASPKATRVAPVAHQAGASGQTSRVPEQPAQAAKTSGQPASNPMMLWGLSSVTLIVVVGLVVLGIWFINRPGVSEAQPPPPPPPATRARAPTLPPSRPSSGQPSPEAINACAGAGQGAVCEFTAPHGIVTGTCLPVQAQLVCVPPGGPPAGAP